MNLSEGRLAPTLEAVSGAISAVPGVFLLDRSADPDHNRSVFSFVGPEDRLATAVLAAVAIAVERIDLNRHQGVHPRIGAVDVVPFVPLAGSTLDQCVSLARRVGKRIWEDFRVPVYLYEAAAERPQCRNLADIRRGGFRELRRLIGSDPQRRPDFGGATLHPTAGATAVGARGPLIAYNIYLTTDEVAIARRIAGRIRERDGGLPAVKALGLYLVSRRQAQVSINLTDFQRTSLQTVFDAVQAEARGEGVDVESSEIIGLVPQAAFPAGSETRLRVEDFHSGLVLEERLAEAMADKAASADDEEQQSNR